MLLHPSYLKYLKKLILNVRPRALQSEPLVLAVNWKLRIKLNK